MKKSCFQTVLLATFFCFRCAFAEEFAESKVITPPAGLSIAYAQAASASPFVITHDGGLEFWLFDAEKQKFAPIAKNTIGDWDHRLHHIQWYSDQLVLFKNWEGLIEIINPKDMSLHASFTAEIKNAPLRLSYWLDDYSALIDETDFYRNTDGVIKKIERNHPEHSVQTGLIIQANHAITSGFHDESIKVWSLPEGELLHSWDVGTWFGKRRITEIALVQGRLLLATESGHLEERSIKTGEKLWSSRPCRNHIDFHYSSQFASSLSINVDDGLFFSCGLRIDYIEPQKNEWIISSLDAVINEATLTNESQKTPNPLFAVETIPNTDLAVLVFADGSSIVINKKQKRVLQKLADVKPGTAPVSYIAATRQLLLADASNQVHLYELDKTIRD